MEDIIVSMALTPEEAGEYCKRLKAVDEKSMQIIVTDGNAFFVATNFNTAVRFYINQADDERETVIRTSYEFLEFIAKQPQSCMVQVHEDGDILVFNDDQSIIFKESDDQYRIVSPYWPEAYYFFENEKDFKFDLKVEKFFKIVGRIIPTDVECPDPDIIFRMQKTVTWLSIYRPASDSFEMFTAKDYHGGEKVKLKTFDPKTRIEDYELFF